MQSWVVTECPVKKRKHKVGQLGNGHCDEKETQHVVAIVRALEQEHCAGEPQNRCDKRRHRQEMLFRQMESGPVGDVRCEAVSVFLVNVNNEEDNRKQVGNDGLLRIYLYSQRRREP